ncbi:MAG: prepilin-type N-terminal cleavage/methylation domain-containing protein [Gemmatimonadota bacterium]
MEQSCVEQTANRETSEGGFGLVEVLVALIVLSVGLLGVGGLALVASQHTERASSRTGQELAAQRVIEGLLEQGYAGLADETGAGPMDTTITVKGESYTVTKEVEQASFRVRRIVAEVEGTTFTDPITRTTRIAEP